MNTKLLLFTFLPAAFACPFSVRTGLPAAIPAVSADTVSAGMSRFPANSSAVDIFSRATGVTKPGVTGIEAQYHSSPLPDRLASPAAYVRTYPAHVVHTLAPLEDVRHDALAAVATAVLVLAAYGADSSVDRWVVRGHKIGGGLDAFGSNTLPNLLALGYLAGASGGALAAGDTKRAVLRAEALVEAIAAQGILVGVLKRSLDRRRPNGDHYAFPSGHTSYAFATAGLADGVLGHRAGVPAFAAAAFVGATRITLHRHWLSDVVAGAALGTSVGELVGHEHRREEGRVAVRVGTLNDGAPAIVFSAPLGRP